MATQAKFLRGNLNCHISEKEDRTKLKFGEKLVFRSLNFVLRDNQAKFFRPEYLFKIRSLSIGQEVIKLRQSSKTTTNGQKYDRTSSVIEASYGGLI